MMAMDLEIEGVTFNYVEGEVKDVSISYSAKSDRGTRFARSYGAPTVSMEDYAANSDLTSLKRLVVEKLTAEWQETSVDGSPEDGGGES